MVFPDCSRPITLDPRVGHLNTVQERDHERDKRRRFSNSSRGEAFCHWRDLRVADVERWTGGVPISLILGLGRCGRSEQRGERGSSRSIYLGSGKTRVKPASRTPSATDSVAGRRVHPRCLITISICRVVCVGKRWNQKSVDRVAFPRGARASDSETTSANSAHTTTSTSSSSLPMHNLPSAFHFHADSRSQLSTP